jgi:glycosyltransferase involved in cell wall biosynthesis
MSISLIITTLNESNSILPLLESIHSQNLQPSEVVLVDGGSSDDTVEKIKIFSKKHPQLSIRLSQNKGNRSVGRNAAIILAQHSVLAITDAGCTLHPEWLKNLVTQYEITRTPVVSGYYASKPHTTFQKAVIPYVLVMPDKVSACTFLPATRSMLLEKKMWKQLGGFDETLSDNEDYAFAKKLEKLQIPRSFAQNAVVFWDAPTTLKKFYWMLYRFARGDVYAGIVRPKVILLFARYFGALSLVCSAVVFPVMQLTLLATLALGGFLYLLWSITKHYRYAPEAWFWFPVLQLTADCAVLFGSVLGWVQRRN